MTQKQLHSIEKFSELQTDSRFVGLLMYLRKNRPRASQKELHGMIQDSGRVDAYLELIDKIEDVFRAPQMEQEAVAAPPYHNSTATLNQNR